MKKELHPLLAGKAPDYFSLIFETEGEALLLHGDEATARLSFPAIDRNIQRQAGILVVQPVGAQVADKVVQCCNSMDNQLFSVVVSASPFRTFSVLETAALMPSA